MNQEYVDRPIICHCHILEAEEYRVQESNHKIRK